MKKWNLQNKANRYVLILKAFKGLGTDHEIIGGKVFFYQPIRVVAISGWLFSIPKGSI